MTTYHDIVKDHPNIVNHFEAVLEDWCRQIEQYLEETVENIGDQKQGMSFVFEDFWGVFELFGHGGKKTSDAQAPVFVYRVIPSANISCVVHMVPCGFMVIAKESVIVSMPINFTTIVLYVIVLCSII